MSENELTPVNEQEIVDNANEAVNNTTVESANVQTPDNDEPQTDDNVDAISNEEVIANEEQDVEKTDEEQKEVVEIPTIDVSSLSREELIDKLNELLQVEDVNAIKTNVANIKIAFIEKTRAEKMQKEEQPVDKENAPADVDTAIASKDEKDELDELETKFNESFGVYKSRLAKFREEQEKNKEENLASKLQILEQMKAIVASNDSLKAVYDEFRVLQDKWKEIGAVPRAEVNNLWQNYHYVVESFFDKVRINRELRDLDFKKNMEAKIALCEKVEALLLETSDRKAFDKLQEYREEWKSIGQVPLDKKDELWERFKAAVDKINERRRQHYEELHQQQDSNYAAKQALVEQTDALLETMPTTIKAWQEISDKLNEIFQMWRSIGSAAKEQNDEIWSRFKPKLDAFFAAKKEFFNNIKETSINNLNLKIDLCAQAEAVKDSEDWNETTRILKDLQQKWKEIGAVPKNQSEKLWKRFRAACDDFFNRKEEHFKVLHGENDDNLKLKLDLIEKIKNLDISEDDVQGSFQELKDLQREWMEIGHVPFKEKNNVQNAFRTAVDEKLEQLRKVGADVSNYKFKAKIAQYKDNPNSNQLINKERNQMYAKLQSMKDEVATWENNIGFLSESKNANLLKEEFEKKIQRSKQEIALLEAKIKYLDEEDKKK